MTTKQAKLGEDTTKVKYEFEMGYQAETKDDIVKELRRLALQIKKGGTEGSWWKLKEM